MSGGKLSLGNVLTGTVDQLLEGRVSERRRRVLLSLARHEAALVGLVTLTTIILVGIFAPLIAPYDPTKFVGGALQPPSTKFLLGTDMYGRDILSRIIFGARVTLVLAAMAVGISSFVGTLIGAVAGFYGGRIDEFLMRVMDMIFSFPSLVLAIFLVATFGANKYNAALAISVVFVPQFARVIRSNALALREEEFIKAAYVSGGSKPYILLRHVVPNGISEIIVQTTVNLASAILIASGLNFLGLGVQPPTPSWGYMLANGRTFLLRAWWISTFPGAAIMITVLAANIFGDGLRDALDPRNTQRAR